MPPTYPFLEVITGPDEGRIISLQEGEQLMGRSGDLPILLKDTSVSRTHAQINVEGEKISLQDLASRNGVFVNGVRVKQFEPTPLHHRDEIRIGLYLLRLVLSADTVAPNAPATFVAESLAESPVEPPAEPPTKKETKKPEVSKEDVFEPKPLSDKTLDLPPIEKISEDSLGTRLKITFFVFGLMSVLSGLYYFYDHRQGQQNQVKTNETTSVQPVVPLPPVPVSPAPVPTAPMPQTPPASIEEIPQPTQPPPVVLKSEPAASPGGPTSRRRFNIFLDVSSLPTTARIFFDGKDMGLSPLKVSVPVENDKDYTVMAQFDLRDLHDQYQQKLQFKADPRKEVVPLVFNAELGVIKILKLPRNVSFQLTGTYSYDKTKTHPVILSDIIYGKPLYVPYGSYVIELKEKTRVGNSKTYVEEIRYHRGFEISAKRRTLELSLVDRDLQFYPARLQSIPSGAMVYVDGTQMGTTPFEGDLPLGRHELKLVRTGYFDYVDTLDMRTNTSYEATIILKTSQVGELLNKAKDYQKSEQYKQAIVQLVEALKLEATDHERGEAHVLLGENFYRLKKYDEAESYFEKAKTDPSFHNRALLGLARNANAIGDRDTSLIQLVAVLVNARDDPSLYNEAEILFQQISPIKSVIYIHTDPPGALVTVNRSKVAELTPLILSDLSLGIYRIEIQRNGYQAQQIKKDLKLGEFIPIFVKLTPENL